LGKLILVSGGARSGKSGFAEMKALETDKPVAYLATAQALDEEMRERIETHRARRPGHWQTFEEPFQVEKVIRKYQSAYPVWILDCITLYVSNLLLAATDESRAGEPAADAAEMYILRKIEDLLEAVADAEIILYAVTNEVGWGLVPPDPLSRLYRDIAGRVNQRLAAAAEEVYMLMLGLPVKLKPQ
jgi:adenosylcobinamide kinase/adenosylcobinamide-phosphate guanylyltransferase